MAAKSRKPDIHTIEAALVRRTEILETHTSRTLNEGRARADIDN